MKIEFTTETGSAYLVDTTTGTWNRLHYSKESGVLRGEGGKLTPGKPPIIKVGMSAYLYVEPHPTTPKDHQRIVVTSPVEAIVQEREGEPKCPQH